MNIIVITYFIRKIFFASEKVGKEQMRKKTKDYDSVFKTLKLKHSRLFIPVINEMFGKTYPMEAPVEVLPSEGFLEGQESADGGGRIQERDSDFLIRIGEDRYLLEFQTYEDNSIAIRIAEYAFIAGRQHAEWDIRHAWIRMPMVGLIFLRRSSRIYSKTCISFQFPEGEIEYVCRNVVLSDFSKEAIISKKLYPFVPFYIARYEKVLAGGRSPKRNSDPDKTGRRITKQETLYTPDADAAFEAAIADLEYLRDELIRAHDEQELTDLEFLDLTKFVNTIITHITNGNEMEERLVKIMGGIVLETESERLLRVGREQGIEQGIEQGRHEGILNVLISLVRDKLLDCAEAAKRAGMTEEQFRKQMQI